MKNGFYKVILFTLCVFFCQIASSQSISIQTKYENILIHKDSSFERHISVLLKKSNEMIMYPIFYDTELEKISDVQLYAKKGKKFKILKEYQVFEENVQLDYITSKKVKSIMIPSGIEAKIEYKIKCSELMYFSGLHFFSNDVVDTLKYQINIPNTFKFEYDTINTDSLSHINIDSIKSGSLTKWKVDAIPLKVAPDPLMFFGIYKDIKAPMMRTLIFPNDYNRGKEYMNKWYLEKAKTRRGLNSSAINKIDELTDGIIEPVRIIDILYNYVKNNFKYVAIEIGMGAFIPTHVNEVFKNKEGDCKDLSNFLSEALNYKGIRSDIALAATDNHISNCDFPSLSSANHVICLAYLGAEPILLDPTDPIHKPRVPVQSLQKRSLLIVNNSGGEFYEAPSYTSEQNLIDYKIELEADSSHGFMKGDFEVVYNGISGNFLRRGLLHLTKDEINDVVEKHYELVFDNQSISNFELFNQDNLIEVDGVLSVKNKIFKDGLRRFLFIDFLPKLIETVDRETLLEGTNLGSPFKKKVKLKINMDESHQTFESIHHNYTEEGVSLSFGISSVSEFVIECDYEFNFDYISIDKKNLDVTNEILKSFNELTNEPIIFESKS
ncbi:transglutaminase domain-containing protein [Flavobacteriaceae bacterium SZ-1-7]|uniref:transglutaminase-like domain-containing protein n=1 Tax=Tamlana sedimenti TaxID=3134126 RepID=UPI0031279D0C